VNARYRADFKVAGAVENRDVTAPMCGLLVRPSPRRWNRLPSPNESVECDHRACEFHCSRHRRRRVVVRLAFDIAVLVRPDPLGEAQSFREKRSVSPPEGFSSTDVMVAPFRDGASSYCRRCAGWETSPSVTFGWTDRERELRRLRARCPHESTVLADVATRAANAHAAATRPVDDRRRRIGDRRSPSSE
jgi:hypothetical protein